MSALALKIIPGTALIPNEPLSRLDASPARTALKVPHQAETSSAVNPQRNPAALIEIASLLVSAGVVGLPGCNAGAATCSVG